MADTPLVIRVAANLEELRANLAEGVNQIETTSSAMKRMATAYDGSRTISEAGAVMAAIGGIQNVTTLTTAEQAKANTTLEAALEKYKALGRDAPPGMQALADATKATHEPTMTLGDLVDRVGEKLGISTGMLSQFLGPLGEISATSAAAVIALAAVGVGAYELTEGAVSAGEQINNMALKMGISTTQASQLRFAVVAAGGDVDTLSNAVFMMSRRLEDSGSAGEKSRAALAAVGISAKDFIALSTDQQILAISDAFRAVTPNAHEVFDIFGRQGGVILPVLLKALSDLVEKSDDLGATWNDVDTKAAVALGVETRTLGLVFDKLKDSIGVELMPVMVELDDRLQKAEMVVTYLKNSINSNIDVVHQYVDGLFGWHTMELNMPPAIDSTTASSKKHAAAVLAELDASISHAAAMEQERELLAAEKKATDEAAAAAKKHEEALAGLNSIGVSWQDTLSKMDAETVQAVLWWLKAGAAIGDVKEAYYLTTAQMHAFTEEEKASTEAVVNHAKATVEINKLLNETGAILSDPTPYQKATAVIDLWYGNAKNVIYKLRDENKISFDDSVTELNALDALRDKKHVHELAMILESDVHTHEHFVKLAADAQQAYDFASAHASDFSAAWIMHLQDTAIAADLTAREWTQSLGGALDTIGAKADATTQKIKDIGAAWDATHGLLPNSFTVPGMPGVQIPIQMLPDWGPVLPHSFFADGVRNAPGGWSTVGERGTEQMYVPPGANIYPHGSDVGGGSQTVNVYVTQPLGTPDAIAKAVGAALLARQMNLGVRLPGA